MAPDTVGWWLGAAPGIAVVLRTWWQRHELHRRMSAFASAETKSAGPDRGPERKFDLWLKPHCFVRQESSPGAAYKSEMLAFRPKLVRGLLGGGILTFVGGVLGWLIAGGIN